MIPTIRLSDCLVRSFSDTNYFNFTVEAVIFADSVLDVVQNLD